MGFLASIISRYVSGIELSLNFIPEPGWLISFLDYLVVYWDI